MDRGWIGVDLDGTLIEYHGWQGLHYFGKPVEAMMNRVRTWIAEGQKIKIFTARCSEPGGKEAVESFLATIGLHGIEATNIKDFGMIELWDDRCIQVEPNTGRQVCDTEK